MRPDPFPHPGDDAQEPESAAPPAGPQPPAEADAEQQGLFLCLPAGSLDTDQFAQSGPAADMPPDPLLATIIDAVMGEDGKGLAGCSDDQLIGIIAAVRRLESRAAWYLISAVAEFTARNNDEGGAAAEFAADQLAHELHLTTASAAAQMDYASTVKDRLPATFAALHAGTIHPVHVKIIAEETGILSAKDAAAADAVLAAAAGSLTFGKLGAAARRLVLELDPDSAERRKQAARQDAHVRPFREPSGNAGMIARELPPDEVLASMQHVEQRALDLRAAGIPGTLPELRVRAYLDLLQERDTRRDPAGPDDTAEPGGLRDGDGGPSSGSGPSADAGPSLAALVNITVPWSAVTGQSGTPADVAGFGLVHAADARDLLAAAARDPRTRWCVTALHPDGTAAAHGCVTGRHPPPRTSAGTGPDPPRPRDWIGRLGITVTPIARGTCGHDHAEPGYRPSRKLQHLIQVRNARCTAPGCGRAAARCDLDHTVPWDQGGLTCECDLAPLCRHHHRCKQAEGWRLEQPEPGVLVWRTPVGRTYATTPTRYPM
ncbi:MAG TPA: DUF222 domain-containing protein [Streptosporangiaceae bacterium]|nr:DUF222 domain-containing protein [Streptosporangiaceae bacterium]